MTNPSVPDDGLVERARVGFMNAAMKIDRDVRIHELTKNEQLWLIRAALAASDRDVLVGTLREAREAIASLDTEALGMAQIGFGEPGDDVYPIRDELLAKIDAALIPLGGDNNGLR